MITMPCPYLKGEVELSDEREQHIAQHHPDLLPLNKRCIIETLAAPDQIRHSARLGNARLFSRWFPELRDGKYVVVVVVSVPTEPKRHWIITAYIARKLAEGEIEWRKN